MKQHTGQQSNDNTIRVLPCACANLRRASRVVTQLYEQAMLPTGIRATQFTLLQALALARNISQGGLGELLGLDSTTLTRMLSLLRRRGWIQARRGKDRRQWRLSLSKEGRLVYQLATPYWQSAQRRLRRALGDTEWDRFIQSIVHATALAREH